MELSIPRDQFLNFRPPRIFLCNTSKRILGELPAFSVNLNAKWNSYSEISFEIKRVCTDILTGETKIHPLYDKVEAPRNILAEGLGYFALQDIKDASGESDTKSATAFSLEYATSNKYLTNFHINTGEVDSKEVLYNEKWNGIDYNTDMDSFYKPASGSFDPFESYYKKTPTKESYTWEQVQIADENEYAKYINNTAASEYEKLYMKNFPNVQFYNRNREELSLLHLIFENIPEWKIGNVDQSLWRKERKFSEDRVSVYDFLTSTVSDTFGCVFIFDSLTGEVHVHEELEDDSDIENKASTKWATDVFISKDNLASEIDVSYSSDDIKTKLVVTGSENLDIREVNLGRNEIMDLSFYHTLDWMEQDLFEAYDDYLIALREAETGKDLDGQQSDKYPMSYPDAMRGWVAANNQYNELAHAVPAEGNVVLVGDKFEKLYCSHTPTDNAYVGVSINPGTVYIKPLYSSKNMNEETIIKDPKDGDEYYVQGYRLRYDSDNEAFEVIEDMRSYSKSALIKKLNLYHVDEDTEANKSDNILLRLKNDSSDIATIRIYDKKKVATEYDPNVKYYIKGEKTYTNVTTNITNQIDFNNIKETYGADLYTNDYYVRSVVISGTNGISEAPDEYSMADWVEGKLTSAVMGLEEYNVSYIGIMGAYFVLTKDEAQEKNLEDYGVNLLKEKHKLYTTIFQTQTESMFSQEKHQCIVQDEEPEGDYIEETRWLDTNEKPAVLKVYKGGNWETLILPTEKEALEKFEDDKYNYENYQRYMDNFEKIQAVQSVLVEKEREATYYHDGYEISDLKIDPSLYTMSSDGHLRYKGELLESALRGAALVHFESQYTVNRIGMDQRLPLYTFTSSYDPDHTFAVYLKDTTPYVAYEDSQGVHQMIMEYIRNETEISNFFTKDQWIRLSPFIKEDEYNDSNFLLTGYESEEERIAICEELMEAAGKELKSLSQPSLSFSMTMANILALPEFEPLFHQFQLGNFIRVAVREDYVKRARLLEVNINFDDLSDFSCTFGNLVTTKSEVDKHAELLSRAVSAGKTVAKASSGWQRAVDKTNKLEEDIANGLQDAAIAIGSAGNQAISWDSTGMHFRKYKEGSTTEYESEEIAIINNALVATNDSWKTSKAAFGKYKIGNETRWGPLAEYITADTIEGKFIKGGSIQIGDETNPEGSLFIVNEDGSVQIKSGGKDYADSLKQIDDTYRYRVTLTYDGSTIFSDKEDFCTITCDIYDYNNKVTSDFIKNGANFAWIRSSYDGNDNEWNKTHEKNQTNQIIITTGDVTKNATFFCSVSIDDKFLQPEETN